MKRKVKSPSTRSQTRKRNDALNRTKDKQAKKLPGEYPPQDDIMNREQGIEFDEENFSRTPSDENLEKPESLEQSADMEKPVPANLTSEEDKDLEFATGNESDVSREDLEALGPKDLSLDMGDDENILKNRVWPVDMAGEDLDVPGADLDDADEAIGSEDEENNSYSLGGDAHEDDLEGK